MAPAQAQAAQRLLQRWQSTIERYESDPSTNEGRKKLTSRAKAAEEARDHSIAADNLLDLASAALQIAIVLTSASVVLGVNWLAWGGGFLGLLGLALAITGWFAPTLISF